MIVHYFSKYHSTCIAYDTLELPKITETMLTEYFMTVQKSVVSAHNQRAYIVNLHALCPQYRALYPFSFGCVRSGGGELHAHGLHTSVRSTLDLHPMSRPAPSSGVPQSLIDNNIEMCQTITFPKYRSLFLLHYDILELPVIAAHVNYVQHWAWTKYAIKVQLTLGVMYMWQARPGWIIGTCLHNGFHQHNSVWLPHHTSGMCLPTLQTVTLIYLFKNNIIYTMKPYRINKGSLIYKIYFDSIHSMNECRHYVNTQSVDAMDFRGLSV